MFITYCRSGNAADKKIVVYSFKSDCNKNPLLNVKNLNVGSSGKDLVVTGNFTVTEELYKQIKV